MPSHGREIPIELRAAIATCRILYREKFEEIERKTGVNAAEIMRRGIGRAGSEDFYEVLACLGDLNRPGRDTRVVDGTQLSARTYSKRNSRQPYLEAKRGRFREEEH